jgi:FAD:protein FMN transferase
MLLKSHRSTGESARERAARRPQRLMLVAFALWLMIAPAHAAWHERVVNGIMGTRIAVELWADPGTDGEAAIDAVMAEMRRIDAAMSTYKPDSELSRVNASAAAAPMRISAELFDLLTRAIEFSRLTDGAFDVTYASVGFMYDFREKQKPSAEEIERALPAVNYRHVMLDTKNRTVRYARAGVRIDLGGIAKGYAVDQGIEVLRQRGIQRALVTAGGDSRIIGDRFGQPWIVGLRHPDRKGEVFQRIPLVDAALSTSGDYERYFEKDGVRYHHIIDPSSGRSASLVRSATIIGPDATTTDGLSKTAFVLGAERALELYNQLTGIDAILVTPDGRVLYTKGLEAP